MMRATKSLALSALALCAAALAPTQSRAAIVISVQEIGQNVVVIGSGSANLSALTLALSGQTYNSVLFPSGPALLVGAAASQQSDDYGFISGPGNYGTGSFFTASSGSGLHFGLNALSPSQLLLNVPRGYVSGTALGGTSTYNNATFSSLGLRAGTYTYTWGSGTTADSMTIQVGAAAVPEPRTLVTSGIAACLGLAGALRRRSRAGCRA